MIMKNATDKFMLRVGLVCIIFIMVTGCATSTLYIVRHAEKDSTPKNDPPLTAVGITRANDLARLMKDKHITSVYSTNTLRTLSTAKPTADEFHLTVITYDSIAQLPMLIPFQKNNNALIVGHSNTILEIATTFGVHPTISVGDNDYDNLLIVKRSHGIFGNSVHLTETIYGSVSPE
jgi:phosphohistidine phosphatase SixA